jgi:hypothetical protein
MIEEKIRKNGLLQFRKYDEHLISNLVNNTITFGSARNFNDPFDCQMPINVQNTDEEVLAFFKKKGIPKTIEQLPEAKANLKNIIRSLIFDYRRFTCFSIAEESNLFGNSMFWAHYADKHHGVCLKFKGDFGGSSELFKLESGKIGRISVEYLEKIPHFNYIRYCLGYQEGSPNQYFIATKSTDWEKEREIRFVFEQEKFPISCQYIEIKFNPRFLEGIYLGNKINDNEIEVIKTCLSDSKYGHVKIFQLEKNEQNFTLNPIQIEWN